MKKTTRLVHYLPHLYKHLQLERVFEQIQAEVDKVYPKGLFLLPYQDPELGRKIFGSALNLVQAVAHKACMPWNELNTETHDPRTGEMTCKDGRRRSCGDLYSLARYYFPGTTYAEVFRHLEGLYQKKQIGAFFCTDVKKRVYMNWDQGYRHMCQYKGVYMFQTEWDHPMGCNLLLEHYGEPLIHLRPENVDSMLLPHDPLREKIARLP